MSTNKFLKFSLALMVWLVVCSCQAQIAPLELKPEKSLAVFNKNFFGMHVHNNGSLRNWPDLPIGSLRLWDYRIGWSYLEQSPGKWDFSRLDEAIKWADSRGIEVLLPLWVTPQWASARPGEKGAYGPGTAAEPANLEAWRNYVSRVVARYKGRVFAYQVGNEANIPMFYTGDLATLVEMVRIAHEEIRKVDRVALLIAPSGVGMDQRVGWPSQTLAAGMDKYVNAAAYHLYHEGRPPEFVIEHVQKLARLNKEAGFADFPMWNTEAGLAVSHPAVNWAPGFEKKAIPADLAAIYLPRDLFLAKALGYERYFFYAWDNKMFGFLDPVTGKRRPAADVLEQFIVTLMRARLHSCNRDSAGKWLCELTAANGARLQAWWLDPAAPKQNLRMATPFPGRQKPLDGKSDWQVLEAGAEVEIGPVVTLLEQAR